MVRRPGCVDARPHRRADDPNANSRDKHRSQAGSLIYIPISEYSGAVARSSTTLDVFNAIGEARRRDLLDTLIAGEKAVGTMATDLAMSQPQVSKHLRVLSEVGLVRCRTEGRRRLYSLESARLQPVYDWLAKYEQAWNERMDRMDDYLKDLQRKESRGDT
jgi:DNA-binding transcriptional ArsR family regulator